MRVRLFLSGLFMLLMVLGALIAGCATNPNAGQSPVASPEPHPVQQVTSVSTDALPSQNVQSVVDANNRFAFDLYRKLKDDPSSSGKNIFFSPFSISSAMAITSEGANGKTADEIKSVFHFPKDKTIMRQGFSGVFSTVNAGDNNATSLQLANALWAEKTYPFLPEYIQTADQYYNARTTNLDIKNDPDGSVDTINKWIEEKTSKNIQHAISRDDIDPDSTRLIITNAIYFSGSWIKQFDKSYPGPFRISANKTVNASMMQRSGDKDEFNYADYPDMQVLELPYRKTGSHDLSMLVILPRKDIDTVENSLNSQDLERIKRGMKYQEIGFVYMPKFKIETRYDMPESLKPMGMPTAFTLNADFSGMDGNPKNLYISKVIHNAFVDVNEKGTEAAAVTSVHMKSQGGGDIKPYFFADHPFLFIIQDRDNGNILFMGRVMNPSES